jgi:biopolymer transport protein ExbD
VRFGKQLQQEGDTIPMAPLIDIVFLTLVFFMVTSVYSVLENEMGVDLPTADESVRSERAPGEIIINLLAPENAREVDGRRLDIVVNENAMDIAGLQHVLDRVARHFPGGAVIIRADASALHGRVIAVLDACSKADIQNISFATAAGTQEGGGRP